jgi:membrane protease YdiL (CAAX protease family)
MDRQWLPAAGGIAAAIAITTLMDAAGYSMFSALPLFPLAGLFWYLQKFSRADIGLVLGPGHYYGLAIAYPVIVLGVIASIAFVSGAVDTASSDWNKAMLNMALMSTTGVIMVLITEEGFFRGWLWAALRRAGLSDSGTLVWTSIAFTAWHISAVSLETGFDLPAREIPVYLINATLIGGIFGMLRLASGSVVVAAVCHSVWNGIDYPLFGFGESVGALGIESTHIFGPEVGWLGIACNLAFAIALWRWIDRKSRS